MTTTDTPVNNGVNVEALLGAREALTAAPEAAKFEWRATCEWQNGTHSNSTVEGFFGLGEEQSHRTRYSFDVDHPEVFASEDNGATPVELVLVGLVGCLTAGVAAVAQNREIQLRSVSATIEGAMDVRGILGMDTDVRNGFSNIKVTYKIDADATPDEIKAIVAQASLEEGLAVLPFLEHLKATTPLLRGIRRIVEHEAALDFCLKPEFIEGVKGLSKAEAAAIEGGNAARLLKIDYNAPQRRRS